MKQEISETEVKCHIAQLDFLFRFPRTVYNSRVCLPVKAASDVWLICLSKKDRVCKVWCTDFLLISLFYSVFLFVVSVISKAELGCCTFAQLVLISLG